MPPVVTIVAPTSNDPNEHLRMQERERARKLENQVSDAVRHFGEYAKEGSDGALRLDFEDFYAIQPEHIKAKYDASEIRLWFDAADTSGDGEVSTDEFFIWAMSETEREHGASSIDKVFAKYDKNGGGTLDAFEFERAATEMGFGAVAHDVFRALDDDGSGVISYKELGQQLSEVRVPELVEAKSKIAARVWGSSGPAANRHKPRNESDQPNHAKLDTSSWKITGTEAASVKAQLQKYLHESGAHVSDLVKLFDDDASRDLLIDDMEFVKAMRNTFGYGGPLGVLGQIFRDLDTDGSGQIGFDELYEFVRGRRHALDQRSKRVREMVFLPQPHTSSSGKAPTLRDIHWDVDMLRHQIQRMMKRCRVGTVDVIKAWDTSGDRKLSAKEFLDRLAKCFKSDMELWEDTVRAVALKAFDVMVGKKKGVGSAMERQIDIVNLEQWLHHRHAPIKHQNDQYMLLHKSASGRLVVVDPTKEKRLSTTASLDSLCTALIQAGRVSSALDNAARTAAQRKADKHGEEARLKGELRRLNRPRTAGSMCGMQWGDVPIQRWEVPTHLQAPSFLFQTQREYPMPDELQFRRRVRRSRRLLMPKELQATKRPGSAWSRPAASRLPSAPNLRANAIGTSNLRILPSWDLQMQALRRPTPHR